MSNSVGPFGWQNWRAYSGGESVSADEVACYTDAEVAGEVLEGLGPFELLNIPPGPVRSGEAQLAVVLRIGYYAVGKSAQLQGPKTNVGGYHGGNIGDELASLISLALDCRLKAAGTIRNFFPSAGPRGRPRDLNHRRPYLAPTAGILPGLPGTVRLDDCVPLLQRYPQLSPEQVDSLLRAARAYQQALSVAEDDPALAWLKLVSAVEAAANQWAGGSEPSEKVLRELEPELAAI